jgi:hypothetical protein
MLFNELDSNNKDQEVETNTSF